MRRKTEPLFTATVFRQLPAEQEQANLSVVGRVIGTYYECWQQAKAITQSPVIQFKEIRHGQKC